MNTAVPYPLDDAILERFTGQRAIRNTAETERRIEQATTERKCTESENRRARRFERRCRAKLNAAHSHLACCRLSLAVRRRGWSPGLAALVASGILAVPLAVIVGIAAPHSLWVLIAFALAVIVAGITFLTMLSDIDVQAAAARLETALQNALCARKAHDRTEVALQGRIAVERAARKLHAGLLRAINSELNELINTEVDNMAGLDFERHLERVFNALGYQVKHTGQSGDQGVDLIIQDVSQRIAVQAKCWQGPVGNSAVQEVHAGRTYHQCHTCIVVTNSTFTRQAKELAKVIGCQLIEGKDIRELIRGRIRLGQIAR